MLQTAENIEGLSGSDVDAVLTAATCIAMGTKESPVPEGHGAAADVLSGLAAFDVRDFVCSC